MMWRRFRQRPEKLDYTRAYAGEEASGRRHDAGWRKMRFSYGPRAYHSHRVFAGSRAVRT